MPIAAFIPKEHNDTELRGWSQLNIRQADGFQSPPYADEKVFINVAFKYTHPVSQPRELPPLLDCDHRTE